MTTTTKLCYRNKWSLCAIVHQWFSISLPRPSSPSPTQDVREWTRTLNQSPGHAMFQYQTFHMTLLTLSFYALLHPDSIKNGLTALLHDWRAGSLPSSVLNIVTNGRPWRTLAGITQSWRRLGWGGARFCWVGVSIHWLASVKRFFFC